MNMKQSTKDYESLQDQFGYNFWYVADLYMKYLENKNFVSEYWQQYFSDFPGEELNINKQNGEKKQTASKISSKPEEKELTKIQHTAKPKTEVLQAGKNQSDEIQKITGVGTRIIENMTTSLTIPTATSQRTISARLLEENRRIINQHFKKMQAGKVSFTHIVAYAIVEALKSYPSLNNAFSQSDGVSYLIKRDTINFGLAIDLERKDGSRSLIVPNIKSAEKMNFSQFYNAYEDIVERSRSGKIEPDDFQGTTISLTNPGTVGTVSSIPRLMVGQGAIIAIGVIDYPSQYQGMDTNTITNLGIGKVMNITSTYDHRIIQGAESGLLLKKIDDLLLGKENFYQRIFSDLNIPQMPVSWSEDTSSRITPKAVFADNIEKHARILQLINIYRVRGHLIANLNPLGSNCGYHAELDPATYGFTIWDYDRTFITGGLGNKEDTATLREILDILQTTYCDKIGVEYMHIQNPEEKSWLQSKMEPVQNVPKFTNEEKIRIMWKLVTAEGFEHYLQTKFIGHKRFSLEGSETMIPVLDYLIGMASDDQVKEIFLGMAHRGRLNILANIIGKSYEKIFSEFSDIDPFSVQGSGDVKYHLGASGEYKARNGKNVIVSVAPNPSHLEWVNPVVEGIVRAKQQRANDKDRKVILPVLIHGDAAFAGQGVVAETINLSQLKGYRTGGTIHIIINNQIGFTTTPEEARSSIYASDVAKMVQAPIFHVNGDDPEASLWVTRLAYEYRQRFNKDVVIDLFGYRRHGHNEGDDPAYTQPIMYKKIKERASVKEIYKNTLISQKLLTEELVKEMESGVYQCLNDSFRDSQNKKVEFNPTFPLAVKKEELKELQSRKKNSTEVSKEVLDTVIDKITILPQGFEINPKLKKILDKRREILTEKITRIDWAYAEALSFGTLLLEGTPIRLSGQDSARGTFSQRHLVLTNMYTGEEIIPHNSIFPQQAHLEPLDSLLSEAAVLGFEFGYSAADPLTLVLWEAQFGDFANSAQVIIDNFISSSKSKWSLQSNLILLLPHGFEGQGPEHSSARLERFLTLCAEDNMYVCNPSTPAQYFHLLRRQIHTKTIKPLICLTPKSLLRLPAAQSEISELSNGGFQEIIDDPSITDKGKVDRLVFVSGKFYYDLIEHRSAQKINNAAIIRVEQFYPFNSQKAKEVIKSYPNIQKIVWAQEEPMNMGAWNFLWGRLKSIISTKQELMYAGRNESASPASGSLKIHTKEQKEIINTAFNK